MRVRTLSQLRGLALLIVSVTVISGCGDDKNNPIETPLGFTDEAAYVAVTAEVGQSVDNLLGLINDGFESATPTSIEDLDDVLYNPQPADSVDTGGGWTVLFLSKLALGTTTIKIDSIQYLEGGNPQSNAVGADAVSYRHILQQNITDTTVSYRIGQIRSSVDITDLDTDMATVNGTKLFELSQKKVTGASTEWFDFDMDVTVSELMVSRGEGNWNQGCPTSGTVQVNLEYTYDNLVIAPVSTSWTIDVVFDNGSATVTVTRGEQSANYVTDFCTVAN
ncbi:MAG: hypothetical protein SGI97_06325 [candidate division Zixibacteria bacterium]|nr:hypothetical protein [candidate division Zixibacteria bacterium]